MSGYGGPVSTQILLDIEAKLRLERKAAGEKSFREFCFAYLRHHFPLDPSQMHEDLFVDLQEAIDNGEKDYLVRAAPRGNAKSTIVSLALVIWCAVYKKKHYILTLSDTSDQAEDFLQNVKNEFEENELLIEDFGELEGLVWTNSNLILANDVRIQALGSGKRVRGRKYRQYRPDLIICDDLENDENIQSPDQRKKLASWYFKALSKAASDTADIIFIGTIIHYDSLLSNLLKNPVYSSKKYQAIIHWSESPLWDEWERIITDLENPNRVADAKAFFEGHKLEMITGTQVLWPQKEDYYNLMIQRIVDGPAAFSSEKQNEPLSDDERRFHPDWIRYYDDLEIEGKELFVVGFVDPSLGKNGGDYSSICTIGEDSNHIIYILDCDIAKRHPDIIIGDVYNKQLIYHYKIFGVEVNQFQEYFKDSMAEKVADKGVELPLKGIRQHSDKTLRIQSLQPDVKNGRVRFKRDQQKLVEQLINFPNADHDDGPDSLEGAIGLLGKRSAIAEYYKDQANEANQPNINSFLQNPTLQGIIR